MGEGGEGGHVDSGEKDKVRASINAVRRCLPVTGSSRQ